MANFGFKAISANNRTVRGVFDARDADDALNKLREQGLFVTHIEEKESRRKYAKLRAKQIAEFCKALSVMLKAGLPLIKVMGIIIENEAADARMKGIYADLQRHVRSGKSLSEAMGEMTPAFPELMINMFYTGEVSGNLAEVSEKMAAYYTAEYKLRGKIKSATSYPKGLLALVVIVLIVLFIFVLPGILDVVGEENLPPITQFMKNISDYLIFRWYNVLMFGVGIFAVIFYLRSLRQVWFFYHKLIVVLPKIGPLVRMVYTARFARTLSSMYSSGVQLVQSLNITSKILGNLYIEGQFPEAIRRIKGGEIMSVVLGDIVGFSPKLSSIILIGEETGRLDEILTFSAESFEYDADQAITSLLGILQPVLLIVAAIIILLVIVSVLLPIFQMYETIGM